MGKVNNDIIKYVVENYTKLSIKELIEYTKISQPTILKIVKNNNIMLKSVKKYVCDDNYFKMIDSEEKSYWLGFLFADGYVRMHKGRSAELKLKLSIKDKHHVELFKKTIKSSHPINDYESVVLYKNKKSISLCSSISIYNKLIVTDLYNIGCVNKKSMIIEFPYIKEKYFRHFIRGYFDGDGCIYTNNGRNVVTIISGSLIFLEQIQKIFYNDLNISSKIHKDINTYRLFIHNKKDIFKIYEYFYIDSNVFLNRKKNKFGEINFL